MFRTAQVAGTAALIVLGACRFDAGGVADDAPEHDATPGDLVDSAAEPPLGSGKDGELTVSEPTTVNAYAAVSEDVEPGSTTVRVDTAEAFSPGDLVLLHHAAGLDFAAAPSGDQAPVDLAGHGVGTWGFARVREVGDGALTLEAPVGAAFPALASQVVRVPELTRLTVEEAGEIVAAPWDGRTGGVVAVLVTGSATIDGRVHADARGFRGGAPGDNGTHFDCVALDGPSSAGGGARKGEGPVLAEGLGHGNRASGAGGGNCHNAGGGGGGGAGRGGDGGGTWIANQPVGGRGGAAVVFDPDDRLVFGGGGGAGDANDDGDDGAGGAGGGIVLLRARSIVGAGAISASGGDGDGADNDGGGGGGAGGVVALVATDSVAIDAIEARGGRGGDSGVAGSGGGGGGGVVVVDAGTLSTPVAIGGGGGATRSNDGGDGAAGKSEIR